MSLVDHSQSIIETTSMSTTTTQSSASIANHMLSSIASTATTTIDAFLSSLSYNSLQTLKTYYLRILLTIVLSFMIISTVIGNILVCLSVILVRKLRHPSNYLLQKKKKNNLTMLQLNMFLKFGFAVVIVNFLFRSISIKLNVSLAISDLCVAILVMPLALQYELTRSWNLSEAICDLWVSFDVTCCTSSILNLCTISIDRYLAITQPLTYGVRRTTKRILSFIGAVWIASCLISIPPVLILGNEHGTIDSSICEVSQNIGYQLYATLGAFYIPLGLMIFMYYKIYVAAKRVVEAEMRDQRPSCSSATSQSVSLLRPSINDQQQQQQQTSSLINRTQQLPQTYSNSSKLYSQYSDNSECATTEKKNRKQQHQQQQQQKQQQQQQQKDQQKRQSQSQLNCSTPSLLPTPTLTRHKGNPNNLHQWNHHNGNQSTKLRKSFSSERNVSLSNVNYKRRASNALRERKASFTLDSGSCRHHNRNNFRIRLPFFILALLRPFSSSIMEIPRFVNSIALWLGYANSMLNPIIYVTFHQDFRRAFKYLLCLQCSTMGSRLRAEAYISQYGGNLSYHNTANSACNSTNLNGSPMGQSYTKQKTLRANWRPLYQQAQKDHQRFDAIPVRFEGISNTVDNSRRSITFDEQHQQNDRQCTDMDTIVVKEYELQNISPSSPSVSSETNGTIVPESGIPVSLRVTTTFALTNTSTTTSALIGSSNGNITSFGEQRSTQSSSTTPLNVECVASSDVNENGLELTTNSPTITTTTANNNNNNNGYIIEDLSIRIDPLSHEATITRNTIQ
ncbi:5-hydroxytryptamine receptor 7 [Blomia tropicalis]|nr:5-hydroxytryptamine receptor 7 [Blomia tropicalis]